MKVHIKFITFSVCIFLIINSIISCSLLYAAAAAPTVGFSSLPVPVKNEFFTIVETILDHLFTGESNSTITVTDEDGKEYTYDYNSIFDRTRIALDGTEDLVQAELDNLETPTEITFFFNSTALSSLPAGLQIILKPLLQSSVDLYNNSTVHSSSTGADHGGTGRRRISASDYDTAVNDVLSAILSCGSGSVAGSLVTINGIPYYSFEIKSDITIDVFDNLGLDYSAFSSIDDTSCSIHLNKPYLSCSKAYYTPYVIDSNNHLCVFRDSIFFSPSSSDFILSFGGSGGYVKGFYGSNRNDMLNFRLCANSDNIYVVLASSRLYSPSYFNYDQRIIGNPEYPSSPIFFDYKDFLGCPSSVKTTYDCSKIAYNISFFDYYSNKNITGSELLFSDIKSVGFFISDNPLSSTNLTLAANQIADGNYSVTGGVSSITSELSEIQKAIYILSQQYGETYEDLLAKLDLIIDAEGNITIAGADGIEYQVSELAKSFDKIFEKVEDINASTLQLLEYLKSLNFEGLESYISSLEGTLDELNQRDKEREAVYGDILEQLDKLNSRLDSLGLDSLGSISADISELKNLVKDGIKVGEIELDDFQINNDSSIFIEKFPFSLPFDLYRVVTLFVRDPVDPVFKIPIKTEITAFGLNESIDEEIVLDLTMFKINGVDIVRLILSFSITVGFIVMLIKLTTKLFV